MDDAVGIGAAGGEVSTEKSSTTQLLPRSLPEAMVWKCIVNVTTETFLTVCFL